MIEAFGLHDMRIHITGSRSAPEQTECRRFNRVPEMLLTMGKTSAMRMLLAFLLLPTCALGANSVVNMSHYDLMRPDFAGMAREGVAGVIHEATFPRLERDAKYAERQRAALEAGLLWGAYHFGDGTNPITQADHFLRCCYGGPSGQSGETAIGCVARSGFRKKRSLSRRLNERGPGGRVR